MKHTPYGLCTLSASFMISKLKQGILTKFKAHFPIYSSTYLLLSLLFHFIFVMN